MFYQEEARLAKEAKERLIARERELRQQLTSMKMKVSFSSCSLLC
jgi:hypothetical protein